MELSGMEMYWLLKLDDIVNLFQAAGVGATVISLVACIFLPLILMDVREKPWVLIKKIVLRVTIFIVCSFLIATFTPTTKQLAAIIVVPKIVNNDQVKEIPEKLLNLGVEWLNELKPEKAKSE